MKLDEILTEWETDNTIDENKLDHASIDTSKLHAKYLKLLIDAKLRKTKLIADHNILRKIKFRYYRGELSRDELKELGWDQWQYSKPLKTEMEEFLKGDEDIIKIQSRIEYIDTVIFALESILTQVKSRDWQIRNAITFKQFLAGN